MPSIDPLLDSQVTPPEGVSTDGPVNESTIICYGMLHRSAARVGGNMLDMEAKLKGSFDYRNNDSCKFGIRKKEEQTVLHFLDGTEFSVLNNHASKALETLLQRPTLEFEAIGSIQAILETIERVTKANDAVVRVSIHIYGPRESKEDIGSHLTNQKLYLQRPDKLRVGATYENPHFLSFADMQISSFENQLDVGNNRAPKLDDPDKFRETISNVYASLTRGANLNREEGDRRLKTTLLPHQEEALYFMLQRENGPIPPDFRLWKAMEGEHEGWYLHAVTKAKNRNLAPETGGGILADEMGMGKSLSTLALITKTLDKAYDWVIEKKANPDPHTRQKPCRATLVVVPSAILINEWFHELSLHLDGSLTTLRYHGPKRKTLQLEDADIVLTTYHTIVSDFGDKSSPLHAMEWYRVVLDEAHIIRRQVTTFFKAVTDLKARSRWCLTGTPIQNRLDDIGSLFAFIRASPFHNIAMFRRFVSTPFDESLERREVATKNLTLLLESLCLRRGRELLHLPDPKSRIRTIEFSAAEREQYEQTKKIMNRALRQKVGESYSKSIFGMFQVQLQLRILCNHGTYQHPFSWAKRSLQDEREDALNSVEYGEINCSACRQSLPVLGSNNLYRTYRGSCAHVVCRECLDENQQVGGVTLDLDKNCPLCTISGVRTSVVRPYAEIQEQNDSYLRREGYSSKMMALISDVKEDLDQTKSIIFSCWTNTLNLIERYLREENISFYRIDGESPLNRRQQILDEFSNSSAIPVLIMTTGTGAFGLNLTTANRVFIIEPQWNPSVENQAVARAIRMNQTKSVLVTRYIIKATVEQEMLAQQRRKLMIAEIGNNSESQGTNGVAEI
ncbi:uncharacterized protein K444DRAFT_622885 [Hyaloscypha bicolor E]|uniref:Uncharacterized protein n=1 Tax=Hyaloscypha bicolor E TaxID=1095630 RepID=A0A2J6SEY2_9HELO|nr:uncharacterized protein K444DRAFT_622885 [Hyaloscypha bicolor E]PMD49328.1 hypothetical protein K444DRAFT_622885 [Hyaloscypha bicolor E]